MYLDLKFLCGCTSFSINIFESTVLSNCVQSWIHYKNKSLYLVLGVSL